MTTTLGIAISSVLIITFFIPECDLYPSPAHPVYYSEQTANNPAGPKPINATVLQSLLKGENSVVTKSVLFYHQPKHQDQMQTSFSNNNLPTSSPSFLPLDDPIKPNPTASVANGKSNKSLVTIKVSKRDPLSPTTMKHGDLEESLGKHEPSTKLEKGEPSSLFDLERNDKKNEVNGGRKNKLILKLDKDYSPKDIADYIFSTGDEKGITRAVWEMLQDGQIMASTEDVIHFLEAVQWHLIRMQGKDHFRSTRRIA